METFGQNIWKISIIGHAFEQKILRLSIEKCVKRMIRVLKIMCTFFQQRLTWFLLKNIFAYHSLINKLFRVITFHIKIEVYTKK